MSQRDDDNGMDMSMLKRLGQFMAVVIETIEGEGDVGATHKNLSDAALLARIMPPDIFQSFMDMMVEEGLVLRKDDRYFGNPERDDRLEAMIHSPPPNVTLQ